MTKTQLELAHEASSKLSHIRAFIARELRRDADIADIKPLLRAEELARFELEQIMKDTKS